MDVNRFFCTALLIATAGLFATSASAAESVAPQCESGPRDMEYIYEHGAQTRCFYPAMTLEETYQALRKARSDRQNLTPTLTPGKDRKIENLGDTDLVEYVWKDKNNLHITQNFPGGMTEFMFTVDKSGTTVTETGHPD
ncbi:hypothetical protein HVZ46_06800 [Citrobacter freundii]|uniref:hypothetical protein n=1 Tax=Citrobacter freundii TaxID=546 RepID=UPI0015E9D99B|nr:hypothetical protein [Citrobacter freundii]QMD24260.1 hypothetical protein HVZ46_06800 [Citrobacter freundii]